MKIMGLIPARSGSKRVKDKNIRMLDGQPLIKWSVVSAIFNGMIDWVVTSTDSREYGDRAAGWGSKVLLRPSELASDQATDFDVIRHAAEAYPEADLVVYLRPTTPIRTEETILRAIKTFIEAGDSADSLRSVEEMGESCFKNFMLRPGPFLVPIGASMGQANLPNQMVPVTYKGNGYVDIIKKGQILKGDLWGSRCIAFITPRVIEIDTEDDLEYAQWWIERRRAERKVVIG